MSSSSSPSPSPSSKWVNSVLQTLLKPITTLTFTIFDILDCIFCMVFSIVDRLIEGKAAFPCCCWWGPSSSPTLHGDGLRGNVFRKFVSVTLKRSSMSMEEWKRGCGSVSVNGKNRWSDCGCPSCLCWCSGCDDNGCDYRLHFVLQPPQAYDKLPDISEDQREQSIENVIFLHGFMSSSSFWSETVFSNLSEDAKTKYRLFAVDLLGFGKSPKPRDCLYTLQDHLEMVEKSVITPFGLNSFHMVAHSMGSVVAIALAAKYSKSVKTVTLVAPPCFATSSDAFQKLAGKRLWPPMAFGASFMSWYEHLGRIICFIVCRNHRVLESILRFVTWRRDLNFVVMDFTRHTHHSAWHTMHNVLCGGAEYMDEYLETLREKGVKLTVIQGDKDQVVPPECRSTIKKKVPEADIRVFPKHDHITVVLNQAKEFTEILQGIWSSCK